jgi:signal transduction histidine kinase
MPQGGRLTIETTQVGPEAADADAKHPGSFVCLSFQDTGCGMDESVRRCLFEPFFTTKGVGRGLGLGLAAVHGIVNRHHGWISVESAAGRGSTFRVYLPTASEVPAERSPSLIPN